MCDVDPPDLWLFMWVFLKAIWGHEAGGPCCCCESLSDFQLFATPHIQKWLGPKGEGKMKWQRLEG